MRAGAFLRSGGCAASPSGSGFKRRQRRLHPSGKQSGRAAGGPGASSSSGVLRASVPARSGGFGDGARGPSGTARRSEQGGGGALRAPSDRRPWSGLRQQGGGSARRGATARRDGAPSGIGGGRPEKVHDELERSLSKHGSLLYTAPSLLVNDVHTSPSLKLAFRRPLLLPIFTNNKLVDIESNPLEVRLLDTCKATTTHLLRSPVKLEVLVLDGDFRYEDTTGEEGWTSDEFSGAIVREREGKRPLLVGALNITMSDHGVAIVDDVSFTDNSSWIRSRRFRIGVRAVPGSYDGPRIREAVTQSFMVKDHRGELYKKHFPPLLTDEIWRLKNIGKEGPIHKRLESEEIKNVQDFLKLLTFNPEKLKGLVGMSDRLWKATVNHAKMCDMGGKSYIFRQEECGVTLTMNPAGEILAARIGGKTFSLEELHPQQMLQVKQLAVQAYQQWDLLEETDTSSSTVSDARNGLMMTSSNLDPAQRSMPDSSSLLQLSESLSQDQSISSGPHCNRYLDTMGGASVTSNSADSVAAAYWNQCMENDHGLIIWNSSTVWDQAD